VRFGQGADSLVFRYTAAGQKVAKLVHQTGKPVQRTDYLGPYQYEQDSLRFFPHAEGRVLRTVNATSGAVTYQREYTLKDHLGNLRLAYRLGQVRTYSATLNLADAGQHRREAQQFDSLSVSAPIATATPRARSDGYAGPAQRRRGGAATLGPVEATGRAARRHGDGDRPGPVPAGHRAHLLVLAGLVPDRAAAARPQPARPARGRAPRRAAPVASRRGRGLASVPQLSGGVPKGYVRLLVFDADSNLVSQQTQQLSQAALNNYESLRLQVVVPQDGYVSAYVGNESNVDVFFDDVTVEHRPGLQVQETQYDPTGLELAGLQGTTPGLKPLNQYKFNGKEFQADLGLNWNHQDWRFFDPQLNRWHVVDPELENGQESWTPYSFGFANAVRYADADGRCPECPQGKKADQVYAMGATITSNGSTWVYGGKGVYSETVSSKIANAVGDKAAQIGEAITHSALGTKADAYTNSLKEGNGDNGEQRGGFNMQTAQGRKVGSNETINGTGVILDFDKVMVGVGAMGGLVGAAAGRKSGMEGAKDLAGDAGSSADAAVGAGLGPVGGQNEVPAGDTIERKAGYVHPATYKIVQGGDTVTRFSDKPLVEKK
jgi:RHS repeat-associated protein